MFNPNVYKTANLTHTVKWSKLYEYNNQDKENIQWGVINVNKNNSSYKFRQNITIRMKKTIVSGV